MASASPSSKVFNASLLALPAAFFSTWIEVKSKAMKFTDLWFCMVKTYKCTMVTVYVGKFNFRWFWNDIFDQKWYHFFLLAKEVQPKLLFSDTISTKIDTVTACIHRGFDHGEAGEALLGALVLSQGQGIRSGRPTHHVHHLLSWRTKLCGWELVGTARHHRKKWENVFQHERNN